MKTIALPPHSLAHLLRTGSVEVWPMIPERFFWKIPIGGFNSVEQWAAVAVKHAKYLPGERVGIKEEWAPCRLVRGPDDEYTSVSCQYGSHTHIAYRADGEDAFSGEWCKPSHIPESCIRHHATIATVEPRTLGTMTEEEAIRYGVRKDIIPASGDHPDLLCWVTTPDDNHAYMTHREAMAAMWNLDNPRYPYSPGMWCWRIAMRKDER